MADVICMQCKYMGKPKYKKRGSTRTEVMGWLSFPFGLPYTLWRIFTQIPICSQCGSEFLVKENTAAGQRLKKIAAGWKSPEAPKPLDWKPSKSTTVTKEKKDTHRRDPDVW